MQRLLRACTLHHGADPVVCARPHCRTGSPPGGSTLMISAPRVAEQARGERGRDVVPEFEDPEAREGRIGVLHVVLQAVPVAPLLDILAGFGPVPTGGQEGRGPAPCLEAGTRQAQGARGSDDPLWIVGKAAGGSRPWTLPPLRIGFQGPCTWRGPGAEPPALPSGPGLPATPAFLQPSRNEFARPVCRRREPEGRNAGSWLAWTGGNRRRRRDSRDGARGPATRRPTPRWVARWVQMAPGSTAGALARGSYGRRPGHGRLHDPGARDHHRRRLPGRGARTTAPPSR